MYETFRNYQTKDLLDMAEAFRVSVAAINGSPGIDYDRISLPTNSQASISADMHGVRYNFSSNAVIKHIMSEIEDMATAADVARERLCNLPKPGLYAFMLRDMEEEARKCLDTHYVVEDGCLWDILDLDHP